MSGGSGTGTPAVPASISKTVAGRRDAPFILERIGEPEIEPVTIAEMITHLREFTSLSADAQAEITGLITSAREWVEKETGRALIDQAWRITINDILPASGDIVSGFSWPAWPSTNGWQLDMIGWRHWLSRGEILLRKSPVLAITSFVVADALGAETAVDPTTWALTEPLSKWPRIAKLSGSSWNTGALKIEFRAGFADRTGSPGQGAEMVPARFKQAIKLHAEAHYDRDEKMMQKLLDAADYLIQPERAELRLA